MNGAAKAGPLRAAASAILAVSFETQRRISNAEQVARFLQDDLTEALAKVSALEERLAEEAAKRAAYEARLKDYDRRCLVPAAYAATWGDR